MKTSVNMVRTMGSFEVIQRTKDGMFNATTLLKQWNQLSGQGKKLDNFFENISTKEFIEAIQEEEVLHTRNSVYVKQELREEQMRVPGCTLSYLSILPCGLTHDLSIR